MGTGDDLPGGDSLRRALFAHSRDAIYLHDLEGRFLDANPAALDLLGYGREEIRTLDFSSLLTSEEDAARAREAVRALTASGRPGEPRAYRLRRKDGRAVWVEVSGVLVQEEGRSAAVLGIARDVTERRRAEESLRFQAQMLDSVEQAVIGTDPAGRVLYANRFAESLYGWSAGEMLGRDIMEVTVPGTSREQAGEIMESLRRGRGWSGELTVRRRDGRVFPAAVTNTPVRDARGELVAIVGLSSDISDRKRQEEAVRSSEESYRTLVELSHDLVWAVDLEGRIVSMSSASRRIYGREPEEMLGRVFTDFAPAGEGDRIAPARAEHEQRAAPYVDFETRMLHRDGHVVLLRANAVPVRDATGALTGYFGASEDVTAERRAQDALRQSEERFRTAVMAAPIPIMIHAEDGEVVTLNDAWTRMSGYDRTEIRTLEEWIDRAHGAERGPAEQHLASLHLPGAERREDELRVSTRSGGTRVWVWASAPLGRTAGGRRLAISVAGDVTERRRAEEELRLRAAALNSAADAVAILDRRGAIEWINPAFTEVTGYGAAEATGRTPRELLDSGVVPPSLYEEIEDAMASGRVWRGEITNRRKDGRLYPEALTITPVQGEGTAHYVAIKRDLTELKQLEAQYLQAQKMESVGRLAGGIAHDFNNLLTVILGRAEQILGRLPAGDPLRPGARQIDEAGRRAASLTRQLLAFSRKQILRPAVLDLAHLAHDWRGVLQRLVGETIELEIAASEGIGSVNADPSQIEQVIMNLVVNARDAMPEGGRLTISVRDEDLDEPLAAEPEAVPPGRYVALAVRDTGTGMDPETREKAFEPFFTTKPPGQGTGLGLATVYGIVEQSGGHVRVETGEGAGSAFTVYLPRLAGVPEPAAAPAPDPPEARGTETVLVVEDEEALRELAQSVLESAGYAVLAAGDGREACERLDRHPGRVDLVFTDVVLPGMSGPELAERVRQSHPGIRVLYTSGYTEDEGLRHGVLDKRTRLLAKPYSVSRLQASVREVLDEPDEPS